MVEGSQESPKPKVSRRKFLQKSAEVVKKVGAAVVVANLPGLLTPPNVSAEQQPSVRPPEILENGFKIIFNTDGLPEKYIYPDGKEINLDKDQVKKTRELAKSQKEAEFLDIVDIDRPPVKSSVIPSKEHPVFKEKSGDEVPPEKLKARGIEIIQGDQIELSIRESAFLEDGPLSSFKENEKTKLIIALIDGPYISGIFMTDPKYKNISNALQNIPNIQGLPPDDLAEKYKIDNESALNKTRLQLRNQIQPNSEEHHFHEAIRLLKARLFRAGRMEPNKFEAWVKEITGNYSNAIKGAYIEPNKEGLQIPTDTAIIFVAVGVSKLPKETISLYFDENGNFKTELADFNSQSMVPTEADSIPDPKNLNRNSNASEDKPESYPYGPQSVALIIYHELMHHKLTWLRKQQGLPPDKSEYKTDILAGDQIQKNWDSWEKSGYIDHSGQCLVIKLPTGNYIYTRINNILSQPQAA